MSVIRQLVGFGLRQALGESADNLAGLVEGYLRDHGQTLPRALDCTIIENAAGSWEVEADCHVTRRGNTMDA